MSKAPAMPMYWDAYLADTTHLTTEEHGAYMLLLAAMWRRNGWVPDDDKDNARILGLTPAKWRRIKARLMETVSGFRVEEGKITQEKLQKTWKNTQEKIDRNRSNGAKGGRPKSSKNKGMAKAKGYVSVNPNQSIPEPEPEPIKRDTKVSLKRDGDLFDDFWAICPRKIGKGAAKTAFAKALRKAPAETLFSAMQRYAQDRDGKESQYTVHPATWLNQERWLDEVDNPSSFHDQFEAALKGHADEPGLQLTHSDDSRAAKSVLAPIQATGAPGQPSEDRAREGDSGRNQRTHLSVLRPRRFGGSS